MGREAWTALAWLPVLLLILHPQDVAAVPPGCDPSVDLTILVDASESMIVNDPYGKPLHNWKRMRTYLSDVIKELPISNAQQRVAIVKYSDQVEAEFLLGEKTSGYDIASHVERMTHSGGNTNIAQALHWTKEYIPGAKRSTSRSVVVLFTDGITTRGDPAQATLQARELRAGGSEVFTVSLDVHDTDQQALNSIATSFQHILQVPEPSDGISWRHAVNQLVYGICNLPVPTREPPFCDVILDVALVIDNSGSIRNDSTKNENYDLLKEFIKSLLDILDVGPGRTRVGALRFSTNVYTEFRLDKYVNPAARDGEAERRLMKAHIDQMGFEGSETNISGALRHTRLDIFRADHGDRPEIQNVAIVIADGESNVDPGNTRTEARLLKAVGTRVYVVAVLTSKFDERELRFISSDPDSDHYFVSPTIRNLPAIKNNLLKHVCQQKAAE